jgi:hypothetical protein
MAKKIRVIPTMMLSVNGDGKPDIESIINNDTFSNAVYLEAFEGIKDAINTKKKTVTLFTIGRSEYFIELDKNQWEPALQACINKFEKDEQYEKCIEIKNLIDKIK